MDHIKIDDLTISDFDRIVRRATNSSDESLRMLEQDIRDANHPQFLFRLQEGLKYVLELENALVKVVLKNGRLRRELQRLNAQTQDINVLRHAYQAAVDECTVLNRLLEGDQDDGDIGVADTDPSQLKCVGSEILDNFSKSKMVCACGTVECPKPLTVEEDNFPTQPTTKTGNVQSGVTESYDAWDMRTRYFPNKNRGL